LFSGVAHPRRLFVAADTVRCYEAWWQPALFVVLATVLLPFPALVWYWHRALRRRHYHCHRHHYHHQHHQQQHCHHHHQQAPLSPAQLAFMETLEGPYRTAATTETETTTTTPGTGGGSVRSDRSDGSASGGWAQVRVHWESVVLLRRLALVSLHTFLQFQPFWRAFALAAACAACLGTHLACRPYATARGQTTETCCLSLLVAVALLRFRQVDFAELGVDPPSGPAAAAGFNAMTGDINALIVALLLLPMTGCVLLLATGGACSSAAKGPCIPCLE
jgi:hypothetical protein